MTISLLRQAAVGALALTLGLTTACSDAPSAPRASLAPSAAPAFNSVSSTLSQTTVGDTVVTVFVVGTNVKTAATFAIGYSSKIDFPYSASSICDPATSSYGPGTWDDPCTATKVDTRITAKVWRDSVTGKVATDFQPALRFVPGLRKGVVLTLKNADDAARIDYCTPTGCVNEAATDASLRTYIDQNNGFAYRTIKHFSGYNVVVDRSEDGSY